MFQGLTDKLQSVFAGLRGRKVLSEENISDAVRQVRLALLDADVNYGVVGEFVKRVREKVVGSAVLTSVSPGQQFIKLVRVFFSPAWGSGARRLTGFNKGLSHTHRDNSKHCSSSNPRS